MLKAVSSITNAIGALNYQGTWNANTNSPALVSGVGTKGDYYVVSVAGTTTLDGISNWGIGDWAVFNGSAWQRVEGGADLNGVNLSVSGTSTLDGNATFKDNLTQGTAAKGVNFTANTPTAGMTSQLLNWYEEGTWTPTIAGQTSAGTGTYTSQVGRYTRIGRAVHFTAYVVWTAHTGTGTMVLNGLPFASNSTSGVFYSFTPFNSSLTYTTNYQLALVLFNNSTTLTFYEMNNGVAANQINVDTAADIIVSGTYFV